MRIKYHRETLISFTEKDYKKILKRFDLNNFKQNKLRDGQFINNTPCPLCEKYNNTNDYCNSCILHIFYEGVTSEGCMVLIRDIMNNKFKEFYLDSDDVYYYNNSKIAKNQINKIFKFLKEFEKISSYEYRRLK